MASIVDISQVLLNMGLSSTAPTDEERAVIDFAIIQAEGIIKRILKYDPVEKRRTEFYPRDPREPGRSASVTWDVNDSVAFLEYTGEGHDQLAISTIPIRTIHNLWVNSDGRSGTRTFGGDDLKTEGDDYWANYDLIDDSGNKLCSDGIIHSIGLWTQSPGSIKIDYTAGYQQAELQGQASLVDASPIMTAVIQEAVRLAKTVFVNNSKQGGAGFVPGNMQSEHLGDYSYALGASGGKVGAGAYDGTMQALPSTIEMLADFICYNQELI